MNKKGISLVVASVLLILLAVILATVIYSSMKSVVVSLSPEIDCYGVDFRAEIVREPSADYLNVINLGNLQIDGFYIKFLGNGDVDVYEEVYRTFEPGKTLRVVLEKDYGSGRYQIVPVIEEEGSEGQIRLKACKELYGYDIVLR